MNLLGGGLVKVNLSSIKNTLIFLWTNNVREQLKYKAHASGWRELKVSSYTSSSSLKRSRKYTKALQKAFRTTPSTPPHFYFYIQYLLLIFLWSLASLSPPPHTIIHQSQAQILKDGCISAKRCTHPVLK